MPYVVHITDRALADVDAAVTRIAEWAPQTAANWHARLLSAVQTLEDNPEMWPLAEESLELGIDLHELLFGKRSGVWRILFAIEGRRVNVLRIRHAARDRLTTEDL